MAATRSASKLSRIWVHQTRTYFLKFLHATISHRSNAMRSEG
jgi:hypothetical protein